MTGRQVIPERNFVDKFLKTFWHRTGDVFFVSQVLPLFIVSLCLLAPVLLLRRHSFFLGSNLFRSSSLVFYGIRYISLALSVQSPTRWLRFWQSLAETSHKEQIN